MKFVVAIDGTAASGKGTLGKKIAEHFDFHYSHPYHACNSQGSRSDHSRQYRNYYRSVMD